MEFDIFRQPTIVKKQQQPNNQFVKEKLIKTFSVKIHLKIRTTSKTH